LSEAKRFASELLQWASVAGVGTKEAVDAEQMNLDDMEDAMQIAAALACSANVIVTRNVPDFMSSPVPVMTPEDFMSQFGPSLPKS
jgi:predicted nucleic acid-binding protein